MLPGSIKSLTIRGFFAILLITLVIASSGLSGASAVTTRPPVNYSSITSQATSKGQSVNTGRAVSLAMASSDFASKAQGHNIFFNSIFNTLSYSFDSAGAPVVALNSVNVVYSFFDTDGNAKNIVITEDPGLTQVTSVGIQNDVRQNGPPTTQTTNSTQPYTILQTIQSLSASSTSISISVVTIDDKYCRTFGLLIDQQLNYPDFWNSQPNSVIGVGCKKFSYSNTYSLTPGAHFLELGVSAWVGNWEAKITVNGVLMADTIININTHAHVSFGADFSISASPTSLSIYAGGLATSTIKLTSINNFAGTVSLSASVAPSGASAPTATIPSSVNVPSGGSASVTLNVATKLTTPSSGSTVSITGTAGSVVRTTTVAVGVVCSYNSYRQGTWSGYEFTGSCGGGDSSQVIQAASMSWIVPGVSEAYSYECWFTHCDLSLWAGLVYAPGGSTGATADCYKGCIVQAGSDSGLSCSPICVNFYSGWYEFYYVQASGLANPSVNCLGWGSLGPSVNPGDKFFVQVYYEGQNNPYFDITMIDSNTNGVCSVRGFFPQMGNPYYSEFIGEKPSPLVGGEHLPKFSSFTLDPETAGSALNSATQAYNNQWYNYWDMWNGANRDIHNIQLGPLTTQTWSGVSEPGFTGTWVKSDGT